MYGFISGVTDTEDINFCPKCGESRLVGRADGTCECEECGYIFGVVEAVTEED